MQDTNPFTKQLDKIHYPPSVLDTINSSKHKSTLDLSATGIIVDTEFNGANGGTMVSRCYGGMNV